MMLPRDSLAQSVRRLDYRPPAFLIDRVDLTFALNPDATQVTATLQFRRNPAAASVDRSAPLVLDGEQQRNLHLLLDGLTLQPGRYSIAPTALTVFDPPAQGELTVTAEIRPSTNTALEGLYISSDVFCTQCEPEGFRRIIYFPDRPDVLARYTVRIEADRSLCPVLLSNGNRIASGALPDNRHYVTWQDPFPKPSYLFALVAGRLSALEDSFTTASGRAVALEIWSTPRNLPRCRHAMQSLKRAMRWDEERFGLEYDLDTFMIFCADDFNMGAMENKGLNIFNSKLVLADPESATDSDFQSIEGVVGHEYFHNWTGNRVTCRDWFQLSLKEGLTVFRDQEFSSDLGSHAVERIAAVNFLRTQQFAEDAGPMAHPVRPDEYMEINNFYTSTVYEKGAEVIRMQHTLLGPAAFRRGMDLYFERHDGAAVTCEDFVQAMEEASLAAGGPELQQFRRWYAQSGTPVLHVRGEHDPQARTYTLHVRQSTPATPGQPRKDPFHIPLAVGLVDAQGNDLPLALDGMRCSEAPTTRVLSVALEEQAFTFVNIGAPPVPSLLRGFSAPVRLEFAYSPEALAHLAAHDSDPVSRWDAAQRSFTHAILGLTEAHRQGQPLVTPESLVNLVRILLEDADSDPAALALALAPPELRYLAGLLPELHVEALVAARAHVTRDLGARLAAELERVIARERPAADYAPVQEQIGSRSLRNVCLVLRGAADDPQARALALTQFASANNMTDSIAALMAINDSESPDREDLFARFEARWRDEPLVLDKWFALQATSQRADTLARVRELTVHPGFNPRNPNRVRSLVATYALRNWAGFHGADGRGYAFVADQVLLLDALNAHLSSTVVAAFNQWRRFAEPRRNQQRAALERIADTSGLSPEVTEIVTRSLA